MAVRGAHALPLMPPVLAGSTTAKVPTWIRSERYTDDPSDEATEAGDQATEAIDEAAKVSDD